MFLLVKKWCKYFIGYKNTKKIKPLCAFVRKMTAYRKDFDEVKYVCFLIKDDKLLEKCNEIWDKVSCTIENEFDSNLVYNKKYVRGKIKSRKEK